MFTEHHVPLFQLSLLQGIPQIVRPAVQPSHDVQSLSSQVQPDVPPSHVQHLLSLRKPFVQPVVQPDASLLTIRLSTCSADN